MENITRLIRICAIVVVGIIVTLTAGCNFDEPVDLTGTYNGSRSDTGDLISLTFNADTLTIVYPDLNVSDIYKYSFHNYITQDNERVTTMALANVESNETHEYLFESQEDCITLSTITACKVASGNENNGVESKNLYLYIGVCIAVLGGVIILFLVFRPRIFGRRQRPVDFPKVRVSIPSSIRQQVYARSRGRCERPRCSYGGKVHIHHIDENPSNNSLDNLIAVCPNCHSRIHDGAFSAEAQRSWIAE